MKADLPVGSYISGLVIIICQSFAPTAARTVLSLWCTSKHGEFFPHPYDCTKFLRCSHDRAYVFQCPANLQWNQSLRTCDFPQRTMCFFSESSEDVIIRENTHEVKKKSVKRDTSKKQQNENSANATLSNLVNSQNDLNHKGLVTSTELSKPSTVNCTTRPKDFLSSLGLTESRVKLTDKFENSDINSTDSTHPTTVSKGIYNISLVPSPVKLTGQNEIPSIIAVESAVNLRDKLGISKVNLNKSPVKLNDKIEISNSSTESPLKATDANGFHNVSITESTIKSTHKIQMPNISLTVSPANTTNKSGIPNTNLTEAPLKTTEDSTVNFTDKIEISCKSSTESPVNSTDNFGIHNVNITELPVKSIEKIETTKMSLKELKDMTTLDLRLNKTRFETASTTFQDAAKSLTDVLQNSKNTLITEAVKSTEPSESIMNIPVNCFTVAATTADRNVEMLLTENPIKHMLTTYASKIFSDFLSEPKHPDQINDINSELPDLIVEKTPLNSTVIEQSFSNVITTDSVATTKQSFNNAITTEQSFSDGITESVATTEQSFSYGITPEQSFSDGIITDSVAITEQLLTVTTETNESTEAIEEAISNLNEPLREVTHELETVDSSTEPSKLLEQHSYLLQKEMNSNVKLTWSREEQDLNNGRTEIRKETTNEIVSESSQDAVITADSIFASDELDKKSLEPIEDYTVTSEEDSLDITESTITDQFDETINPKKLREMTIINISEKEEYRGTSEEDSTDITESTINSLKVTEGTEGVIINFVDIEEYSGTSEEDSTDITESTINPVKLTKETIIHLADREEYSVTSEEDLTDKTDSTIHSVKFTEGTIITETGTTTLNSFESIRKVNQTKSTDILMPNDNNNVVNVTTNSVKLTEHVSPEFITNPKNDDTGNSKTGHSVTTANVNISNIMLMAETVIPTISDEYSDDTVKLTESRSTDISKSTDESSLMLTTNSAQLIEEEISKLSTLTASPRGNTDPITNPDAYVTDKTVTEFSVSSTFNNRVDNIMSTSRSTAPTILLISSENKFKISTDTTNFLDEGEMSTLYSSYALQNVYTAMGEPQWTANNIMPKLDKAESVPLLRTNTPLVNTEPIASSNTYTGHNSVTEPSVHTLHDSNIMLTTNSIISVETITEMPDTVLAKTEHFLGSTESKTAESVNSRDIVSETTVTDSLRESTEQHVSVYTADEMTLDPRLPYRSPACQGDNNRRQFKAIKCYQYYQCFVGWAFLLNCQEGYAFKPQHSKCMEDIKMECDE